MLSYNLQGNGQCEHYTNPGIQETQTISMGISITIRSLLCTTTNATPYKDSFHTSTIPPMDTLYLAGSLYQDLSQYITMSMPVNIIHNTLTYMDVCESTVSIRDLALTGDT